MWNYSPIKRQVFEVNSSSQRSGRHVLSQLKETTQSHLVDIPGEDPLKPAYFNNYNTNSFTPKPEALPGGMLFAFIYNRNCWDTVWNVTKN